MDEKLESYGAYLPLGVDPIKAVKESKTLSSSGGTSTLISTGSGGGGLISSTIPYTPSTYSPPSYAGYISEDESNISQLMKAQNEAKLEALEDVYSDLENITTDIGLINVMSKIKEKINRLKNKTL